MVSLEKQTQISEITPVHLMDEEEAVRTYCPPQSLSQIDISVKDDTPHTNTEDRPIEPLTDSENRLDKWDIISSILCVFFFAGVLAGVIIFFGSLWGDAIQLIRDINFH